MDRLVALVFLFGGCREPDAPSDPDADADTDPGNDDTEVEPDDQDQDGFVTADDCDDDDADVYPGAPDVCGDGRVTDCERTSDDGLVTVDGVDTFDDLADALVTAVEGADIAVCRGTWTGPFAATVPVTLRSQDGAVDTVLSGAGSGPVLRIRAGSTVIGFTIQGGEAEYGGGIEIRGTGEARVEDCVVTGNQATFGGGVAVADGTTAVFSGSAIAGNAAVEGGGLWVDAGSSVDLGDSTISGNTADQGGGGVSLAGGTLTGGTVSENVCYGQYGYGETPAFGGGGVSAYDGASLTGTRITGNEAGSGGGLTAIGADTITLTDVVVDDNETVDVGYSYALGGGVYCEECSLVLAGASAVTGNRSFRVSGGVMLYFGTLTGGLVDGNSAPIAGGIYAFGSRVEDVEIVGNSADYSGGLDGQNQAEVVGCVVTGNTAVVGGGIGTGRPYPMGGFSSLTIRDTEVTFNSAEVGSGLYLDRPTTVIGGAISDNSGALTGGGFAVENTSLVLEGTTVERNAAGSGGGGWLTGSSTLSVVDATFAANDPGDVFAGGVEFDGFGAGATFDCGTTGCAPEP